jgi:hypothetical protein
MFKWYSSRMEADSPLPFGQFNIFDHLDDSSVEVGFCPRLVVAGSTTYRHTSALAPEADYEPHVDAYDVAIILLEGEIETLGERVLPQSVIFYLAGEPQGMRNPGGARARYVVFEFHGSQMRVADVNSSPRSPSLLARLSDL